MAQIGRISGPLLFANLERNGIDLDFRDTLDTTALLYFDVNNNRIGVNTETPDKELRIVGTLRTADLISNSFENPNLIIDTEITAKVGDLRFDAGEAISLSTLEIERYTINDNYIKTNDSNADIDLKPNGTGSVEVEGNLNAFGNIYTPGNITFDGNIVFGDAIAQDTVNFNTEVNSNIVPDQANAYSLGTPVKRWSKLYTNLINGKSISTGAITTGSIDFDLRQGNIFYVAVNGDDNNLGDHILSPFGTIKRALEAADASTTGQVLIYVFPGVYQETLPLVVPPYVTVTGKDFRNCIVVPDTGSEYEDVFHLNGDTTVTNLTIKDFYYDSNKGYAFRFAPNGVVNERYPYIQNVSVITQGSVVTEDDPRGFDAGDAGHGAYIDGAELNSSSVNAPMLFHSVTFITPGVDGLTMTNGVRVEWLNSFTYFANRGLYAFNNSTGRVTQDGSTVNFGAELRSIGSANVYGNFGAVADGADCLMYLIQHNFAYVGAGKKVDNNPADTLQSQEVVETNGGDIVFTSIDQVGTFRVGDTFFVDFETGETSIDADAITASGLTTMVIADAEGNETVIDPFKITTGNLRFEDNLFFSVSSDVNIQAFNNIINMNSDVNMSENLNITGDLSFNGNLNLLGNQVADTLTLNVDIEQNFLPHQTQRFNLGLFNKTWQNVFTNDANIGDIKLYNNIITTDVSNADLELRASGSGYIIANEDVQINNDFTVSETSQLQDLNITGSVNQIGNTSISTDLDITGNLSVIGQLIVGSQTQFEEILFDGNLISTTSTNADLELQANGTGSILLPTNSLSIAQNLSVSDVDARKVNATLDITANILRNQDIIFKTNYISTTESNSDLELRANGTGDIIFEENLVVDQNVDINGTFDLFDLGINGLVNITGNVTRSGNTNIIGNVSANGEFVTYSEVQFENIKLSGNVIEATESNSDLELRASGTGNVIFDERVDVSLDLSANNITSADIIINTDLELNEIDVTDSNIEIDDNFITTKTSNSDLELRASGTGNILTPNNVNITQDLTINGNVEFNDVSINGILTHTGFRIHSGNHSQIGNMPITGTIDVTSRSVLSDIIFENNFIETANSDEDLVLQARGDVVIPENNTIVSQNLSTGTLLTNDLITSHRLAFDRLEGENIHIYDNIIETTISNSDLELRANGTGFVDIKHVLFRDNNISTDVTDLTFFTPLNFIMDATGAFQLPVGAETDIVQTGAPGDFRFNTDDAVFEGFADGIITFNGIYSDDRRTKVLATPFSNRLEFIVNNTLVGTITQNAFDLHGLQVDEVFIDNDVISTTNSNADLELRRSGTGELVVDNISIVDNIIKNNSNGGLVFANTDSGYVKATDQSGVVIPFGGTIAQPANPQIGDTRFNTSTNILETWDGNTYIESAGIAAAITEEEFDDLILEYTLVFG